MVTAQLERSAATQQAVSKLPERERARVLVLSATENLAFPIAELIESLMGEDVHVNFVVIGTGELTRWLSANRIYYYLFRQSKHSGAICSDTTFSGFFQLVHQLRLQYIRSRFDVAVFAGASPYLVGARVAAWIAGVPVRVSLAGCDDPEAPVEPRFARIFSAVRSFDSERIAIDPGYVKAVIGKLDASAHRVWAPVKQLAGLFVTFTLAWNFANMSQRYYLIAKRIIDFVAALVLMVLTLPMLLWVIAIRLSRKQPAFTSTRVLGRRNKSFKLYSFGQPGLAPSKWDYKLWWLPSLINVVGGRLSFVGPRLLTLDQAAGTENSKLIYWINPGITGWSQMRGTPEMGDAGLTGMDQLYIATTNPVLDLKIILKWVKRCVSPW